MTVTYTTVDNVAKLLGITIDATTTPSDTTTEMLINWAEDYIDNYTGHAWREKTVSNELHNLNPIYDTLTVGAPVVLNYRKIKTFDSTSGDKIEVWNGNDYEDYVSTKTEGRANDWWCDYERGIVYLKNLMFFRTWSVRVSYRYGEATVPYDIQEAATLLTAISILQQDDRSVMLPDGATNISYSDKISRWKERVKEILDARKEIRLYGE